MANTTGKKFGGRQKGTQNKDTKKLRERVDSLLDDNWDKVVNDLKELNPKERIDTYLKLLEYSLPKLSRSEQSVDQNLKGEIRIVREIKR